MQQSSFSFADEHLRFSSADGQAAKENGMLQAARNRQQLLEAAQATAKSLSRRYGIISMDCVQEALIQAGRHPSELGNAAGSLFKGDDWQCVGWGPSTRVSNHRRYIRLWRLR